MTRIRLIFNNLIGENQLNQCHQRSINLTLILNNEL